MNTMEWIVVVFAYLLTAGVIYFFVQHSEPDDEGLAVIVAMFWPVMAVVVVLFLPPWLGYTAARRATAWWEARKPLPDVPKNVYR